MLKKSHASTIIGFIFILTAVVALTYSFINGEYHQIVWICYSALLLIGIGITTRNTHLLASQINILLIPFLVWNIDFFYHLLTAKPLWGITNYFFESNLILPQILTLQHIFTLPLSFFYLYLVKLEEKNMWIISFIQVTLLFFAALFLTPPEININCAHHSCLPFIPTTSFYPLIWFAIAFSGILITNFLLISLPSFKPKSSNKKQWSVSTKRPLN